MFGAALAALGSVWGIGRWLDARFYSIQSLLLNKMEKMQEVILGKLDYHEKHDDQRFATVNNDLVALRIRNAQRDAVDYDLRRKETARTQEENLRRGEDQS